MLATAALTLADVRPDRLTIGSKPCHRFCAPVSVSVIRIEELAFAWIWKFSGVHAFVANFLAVHREIDFRRVEIHMDDHLSYIVTPF